MNGMQQSTAWHRVASLKPRMRSHVSVEPRHYRGDLWYVLRDESTGRHFRFDPATWFLMAQMNGARTVEQIWGLAQEKFGEDGAPGQDELIRLLGRMHSVDILQSDVTPDTEELFARYSKSLATERRSRYTNPMSLRWNLFDPERFLERTMFLVRPLFTRVAAVVWVLAVCGAILLAATHWQELLNHISATTLAPHNWYLIWLCFPVVKLIHEFGHAYATRYWGGEVHRMGVALLVLTPVPFVDASAASAIPEERRRILVSAAGIAVELMIAAIAMLLWVLVEPGVVRDLAAVVIFIAGFSTVVFNANPLLKFDGYHMLVDAIEVPNLAGRARQYYGYLFRRYAFGLSEARSPANNSGEAAWFAVYGVSAFLYRLFVAFAISLFIASKFFVVGVILAAWVVASMLVLPFLRTIVFLVASPQLGPRRLRALTVSVTTAATLAGLLFYMPVPYWTRLDGVVSLPDNSHVRAAVAGNVSELLAEPGQQVAAGSELFVSEDPFLSYQVEILEARIRELEGRHHAALSEDRVQAKIIEEELLSVTAQLDEARADVERLVTRAPMDGTFIVPGAQDLPGSFARQGQLLGYVAKLQDANVRIAVTQADVSLVRDQTRGIQVWFSRTAEETVPAQVRRAVPAADFTLPSKALGTAGGGNIAVRPGDETGTQAIEQVFQLELALDEQPPAAFLGERVQVRFDHGELPLAEQWFLRGRQLFLRSFGV